MKVKKMIKTRILLFGCMLFLIGMRNLSLPVYAGLAAKHISARQNTSMPRLTEKLQKKIAATVPEEPAGSDVRLVHGATLLATRRVPQGYTSDGTYYYYLSCMGFSGKDSARLRLTRVRYEEDGTYQEDFMTLKGFGHGTNLDCVSYKGKTWLWTGSDAKNGTGYSTSISCFPYQKGKTLKKHAKYHYRIPISGKGNAINCFPAVSEDGSLLAVRYTNSGKQSFKIFSLKKGHVINNRHPLKTFSIKNTAGDFQGFDISGSTIYTIEGSASKAERKELKKAYHPIKIRSYNYASGKTGVRTVRGAYKLSHREPEGIQVRGTNQIEFGLASHYKDKYTCMNIYQYLSN